MGALKAESTDISVNANNSVDPLLELQILDYWDWAPQGLCTKSSTSQYFGNDGDKNIAKMLCGMCPVISQCLAWAIIYDESSGIWGGLTENERKKLYSKKFREALISRAKEQKKFLTRVSPDRSALAALFRDFFSPQELRQLVGELVGEQSEEEPP